MLYSTSARLVACAAGSAMVGIAAEGAGVGWVVGSVVGACAFDVVPNAEFFARQCGEAFVFVVGHDGAFRSRRGRG
jgi:hypothetical protein